MRQAGLILCTLVATPAIAQDRSAEDPLRRRTGAEASPPVQPAYSTPPAGPGLATPPAPAPAPAADRAGTGTATTFTDIVVTANTPATATVARDWTPDPALTRPGPTGLDAAWVRRQFVDNHLIGAPVPLDRIVAMLELINIAFVRNGYINSGVLLADPADAGGGTLHVSLVYGRLVADAGGGAVPTVIWGPRGRKGLTADYIRHRMPSARRQPLDAESIERDFRRLTEDPAVATVSADLRPGSVSGAAILALTVDPAPRGDVYLAVGSSRSPAIGGLRGAIGGTLRNAAFAGDILTAETGLTAGRPDVAAGYSTPFLAPATTLTVRGNYSEAAVIDRVLLPLDIRAREWSIEGGPTQRLIADPLTPAGPGKWHAARTLDVGFRIIHRQTRSFLLGQPFSFSPGSVAGRAEYTALRLTADWVERGTRHVTAISATATQGLEGTRGTVTDIDRPSPTFRVLQAQFSHAVRIDDHGLELRLRLSGQVADGIVYSAERLAAGGAYTVRGYRETLALADDGVIGSVELARRFSLTGGHRSADGFDLGAFSGSVFADGALLRNRGVQQPSPDRLASIGIGLSWVPTDALTAQVSYAYALNPAFQSGTRDYQDRGISFAVTLHPLSLFRRAR